jgi:uncharacterized protein YdaU (DUF1376 family)
MSFAFLPLYTGDYLRDTRHLTPEEHGCYLLLLAHCWDQKGPVPLDERKQCGIVNARSGGEVESLRRVLVEFFVRMDDGWYNHRMVEEITRAEQVSQQNRIAGLASAEKRREMRKLKHSTPAQRAFNERSTVAGTPTPTPTLIPTPIKTKNQGAERFVLPPWVPVDQWQAWEESRRKLRKPLTDGARRINLRTLTKLRAGGNDPGAVLDQSTANGWSGLFPLRDPAPESKPERYV